MSESFAGPPIRAISRISLSYILCCISEMLRRFDMDPLDILIVHTILNANVTKLIRDPHLNAEYGFIATEEPDEMRQGVTRSTVSRFLNLPFETIRRRIQVQLEKGILEERADGLIVVDPTHFLLGNDRKLHEVNILLLRKLLRDLSGIGIHGSKDL